MKKRVLLIISLVITLALSTSSWAETTGSIAVVGSGESATATSFQLELCRLVRAIACVSVDDLKSLKKIDPKSTSHRIDQPSVIVTVGKSSLEKVLQRDLNIPIIAALVSRIPYETTIKAYHLNPQARQVTAIYADPSPYIQLALTRILLGSDKRLTLGTILSQQSINLAPEIQRLAAGFNIDLKIEEIVDEKNLFEALANLDKPNKVDAVLLIPDSTIYNARSIFHLLNAKYHSRQPVIGFSPSVIKAGAIVTTAHSPQHFAQEAADLIKQYQQTGELPTPKYAESFDIVTNPDIARSLNITMPSTAELKHRLSELVRSVQP